MFWVVSRLGVVAAVVVWGGGFAWHAWKNADFLRITDVRFEGDVPTRLPGSISLREGIGLFSFSASGIEAEAERRFPELASVDVDRRFDRGITVRSRYRVPVAMVAASVPTGIASDGVTFAVPASMDLPPGLPVIDAPARQRPQLVEALGIWRKKLPAFFDVVKKLETDKLRSVRVELSDGVVIEWGEFDTDSAVDKARNVLRLMEFFSPGRAPARLRFVTDERIVMDPGWRPAGSKTSEGDHFVKT